eukprot:TRINITY_DN74177_c0_g1_i1.p1 TRINITY_DN74177_c0_g1~~TRINITY_DN74177_c0_g1_i1.p1  ORF type:complete len:659 (+),score=136.85 TRINITY_DN74177_c0_g1_i1:54-2030(+)
MANAAPAPKLPSFEEVCPALPALPAGWLDKMEGDFASELRSLKKAQEEDIFLRLGECFLHYNAEIDSLVERFAAGPVTSGKFLQRELSPQPVEPKFSMRPIVAPQALPETLPSAFSGNLSETFQAFDSVTFESMQSDNEYVDPQKLAREATDSAEGEASVFSLQQRLSLESEEMDDMHMVTQDSEVAKKTNARRMGTVAPGVPHAYTMNTLDFTMEDQFSMRCAVWLSESARFEKVCAAFICFNAIIVGLEVEYAAANQTNQMPLMYTICELVTVSWFVVEMLIRIFAQGCMVYWWMSHDVVWNYLDVFVVGASLCDVVLMFVADNKQNSVLLALKVVRIVRLARITKVISFFRDLRMMVYSMFHTLKSLLWFLVLMCLITYCFAICLTQAAVDHAIALLGEKTDWRELAEGRTDYLPHLLQDFGSVPRTMFTLLKCVSGGVSWGEPAEVISHLGPMLTCTMLIFITFTIFAMLNVITGFFCEDAAATAAKDKSEAIQQQLQDKDSYLRQFKTVFREIDVDRSGYMTLDELHDHIEDENLQAYFAHLEIEVRDAWEIFRLLDVDCSGHVSIEEFVFGCMRLRGYAKTLDVASINYDIERMRRKTLDKLDKLESTLGAVVGLVTHRLSGNTDTKANMSAPIGQLCEKALAKAIKTKTIV